MTTEEEMTLAEKRKPEVNKEDFVCPYCKGYCQQEWRVLFKDALVRGLDYDDSIQIAACKFCHHDSIWVGAEMVYPHESSAPEANNHMPAKVKEIYEEARLVSIHSSMAAAVLLRVALEILTAHLGETSPSLDKRIGNLRQHGVRDSVIKSLDIVRIIANEGGAHAGGIDLTNDDGAVVVTKLFWLVNYIVQKTIADLEEINEMFGDLPEVKRKGAEARDKPKSKTKSRPKSRPKSKPKDKT